MSPNWKLLIAMVILGVMSTSCGSSQVGEREDLDGAEIAKYLEEDGFTIPDGFEFGQALTYSEFVGQPPRRGRFDGPAALGDGSAVSSANPTYPQLQPITCSDVPAGGWADLGFTCSPGVLTTRYPPSGGADTVTVLLTHDSQSAHLFVYSSGH